MALSTVEFDALLANYPVNTALPPHLSKALSDIKKYNPQSTSCVMQVCEALNKSGVKIPAKEKFRADEKLANGKIYERYTQEYPPGSGNYFILAVDELEAYLRKYHGSPTVTVKSAGSTETNGGKLTKSIQGLQGIITFGKRHVELWDGDSYVQNKEAYVMADGWLWQAAYIYFWEVGTRKAIEIMPAVVQSALEGWWLVNDGTDYYYYFNNRTKKVVYTETAPKSNKAPLGGSFLNSGDVSFRNGQVVIDWNAAGDGITRETFALDAASSYKKMSGRSNRFGNLSATKFFP
jgi:hypothetical protein